MNYIGARRKIDTDKIMVANNTKYTKFVLLSRGRTGSSLLHLLLNSHPNAICMGEFFSGNTPPNLPNKYPVHLKKNLLNNLHLTSEKPISFLENHIFINYPITIKSVGFRIAYYHLQAKEVRYFWDYLVKDNELKIIHLKRRNMLRMLVSWKIAQKTGTWINWASEKQPIDNNKEKKSIFITPEQCLHFFKLVEKEGNIAQKMFKKHDMFNIYYEDFSDKTTESVSISELLNFLQIPYAPMEVCTKKQNPETLSILIENFNQLTRYFQDTKWSSFLSYDNC